MTSSLSVEGLLMQATMSFLREDIAGPLSGIDSALGTLADHMSQMGRESALKYERLA